MFIRLLTAVLVAALSLAGLPAFVGAAPSPIPSNLGCAAGDPVVWLNTSSKVYHVSGDPWYGATKSGKYMCKSAADAAGAHQAKPSAVKTASPKGSPAAMSTASPTPAPAATKTPKPKKHHATPAPSATST